MDHMCWCKLVNIVFVLVNHWMMLTLCSTKLTSDHLFSRNLTTCEYVFVLPNTKNWSSQINSVYSTKQTKQIYCTLVMKLYQSNKKNNNHKKVHVCRLEFALTWKHQRKHTQKQIVFITHSCTHVHVVLISFELVPIAKKENQKIKLFNS